MAKKSVRLSDIAEKLDVSTVTVSNALAGQKGVSEELRERIRQTAVEMGYRPKAAPVAAARKIFNVGVIISEKYLGEYPSYYWKVYQEFSLMAGTCNCVILFETLRHESERTLTPPLFAVEQKIQGLVVIGEISSLYLQSLRERTALPMVFVDFTKRSIPVPSVMANNFYGMYQMVSYLIHYGHREIAYVGNTRATNSIMDRYFGYCKALMENGIPVNPDWVLDDRTVEGQIEELQLPKRMPTAFACNCDLTASVVTNQLVKCGYRVPQDISIVGFDNYLYDGLCDVKITTYEVNLKEMVRYALETIIAMANTGKPSGDMMFVSGRIVEKESVLKINVD